MVKVKRGHYTRSAGARRLSIQPRDDFLRFADAEAVLDLTLTLFLAFVFLDALPLDARAEPARCAAAQGKFWGIHDRLFATQGEWAAMADPNAAFGKLAAESGVDMSAWNQCLADHVMLPMIEGDQSRGRTNGVDQTPYFFIGERKVGGAVPASFMRKLLDSALAQAGGPNR